MNRYFNLFFKTCITAVFPMFLGTLLFSGVIETYKNDMTSRKEMLNDYYRPMREVQAGCQDVHNKLFLKYYDVSGAAQAFYDEIKRFKSTDWNKMSHPQFILSKSIVEHFTENVSELEVLKKKKNECFVSLHQKYTEMAIVTGTYKEYEEIIKQESKDINKLYQSRKEIPFNSEAIQERYVKLVRDFVDMHESEEQIKSLFDEMENLMLPLVKYYYELSKNERLIFDVESSIFGKINNIYTYELNSRYERGYVSKWFL